MKLGIIGYGKMSSAIAKAAKEFFSSTDTSLFVCTPSASSAEKAREELAHIQICESLESLCSQADLILFGVKPQMMLGLLQTSAQLLQKKGVISIAAGLPSRSIQAALGDNAEVVRVMPNLGALVGKGMTLISEEHTLRDEHAAYVKGLFASFGKVKFLPEGLMDIGSVLSGSSGAFYTVFVEALAEAGLRRGLKYQDALELALQNHAGTILQLQEGMDPSALRVDTSSPSGTTIEGLMALEQAGLRRAMHDAVEASFRRCVELSRQ